MKKIKILLMLCTALGFNSAFAATKTATFNSTSQVAASCSIATYAGISGMHFPTVTPEKVQQYEHSVSIALTAKCTKGTAYAVTASTGNGTYAQRFMKHANGDKLIYQLYHDGDLSRDVFGDGTSGTFIYNSTGNGNAQLIHLYASLETTQYVTPGAYSDSITFTLTY